MKSIAFALFTLLAACTFAPPGYDYHVVIDPAFPTEDVQAIHTAIEAWQTILDGHLSVSYDNTGTCGTTKTVCIHTSSQAAIVALGGEPGYIGFTDHHNYVFDSSDIYIPLSKDAGLDTTLMTQVLAHEFGHVMGLSHVESGPLMCANQGCAATLPTCGDYAQWAELRGTWEGNASCPCGGTYTLTSNNQTISY
jgi:hypothetical protein